MQDEILHSERAPWGDFPTVVRNSGLGALSKEPEYLAAKGGEWLPALNLVDRLLLNDTVFGLRDLAIRGSAPVVVPVIAVEATGHNKIPLAFATVLAYRLGLDVDCSIRQREKVFRTDSGADHRLAFNPSFIGEVKPGRKYIIVDDTIAMGGTLAALRGYIENRGGKVVAAAVMTAHEGALQMPVKQTMLDAIARKHGPAMNDFWTETFGYGIDQLTQGEAGHLKAASSVDTIRGRLADARHAHFERIHAGGAGAPLRAEENQEGLKASLERFGAAVVDQEVSVIKPRGARLTI